MRKIFGIVALLAVALLLGYVAYFLISSWGLPLVLIALIYAVLIIIFALVFIWAIGKI
jgi:hypothetical protein